MLLSITDVAAISDKVHWSGRDSFTARCLGHKDRKPSMTVTQNGEMLLLHCHAGCTQDELLDAAGMKAREGHIVPTPPRPKRTQVSSTKDYALKLYAEAGDGVAGQGYAITKRITHEFGARRGLASGFLIGKQADCILAPNRDWDNNLIGVECINPEGVKQTFGSKGILILGHPEGADIIHICEGWATAWAVGHLFPRPYACIVTFGKSRLRPVAVEARKRFNKNILIHADGSDNRDVWDLWTDGEGEEYARRVTNAK